MQADLYINLLGYSYFQRDFWVNGAYFAPAKPLPLTQEYLWNIPAVHGAELLFSNAPAAVDRRRMQLINDFKIRHVQFGGYDLVITHQVTKLGELSKNKKQACGDRQACKVLA